MRRVLVVLLGVVLSASCSAAPPRPVVVAPSSSARPVEPITLAFAGDVHFVERTLDLLSDPSTAFGPVSSVLSAADVAMVNLETAVTDRGTEEPKTYHFRAPATSLTAVRAAGVDVVSLANNHTLDYGQVGLSDTLSSAASAGLPFVGAGANASAAYAPWVTTVRGVRIAFLGLSQVSELSSTWAATATRPGLAYGLDVAASVAAVRSARAIADVVVVYVHWGEEYSSCPVASQTALAAALASAGAAVVVGTHAHVLQGSGWLGRTFVAYGLSNFLWWYNDAGSNDTGVLVVRLAPSVSSAAPGGVLVPAFASPATSTEASPATSTEASPATSTEASPSSGAWPSEATFVPAHISRTTGQPIPSTGSEATRISSAFEALRPCTGLAPTPPAGDLLGPTPRRVRPEALPDGPS